MGQKREMTRVLPSSQRRRSREQKKENMEEKAMDLA